MAKIDEEMDAVDKTLASEDVTVRTVVDSKARRIALTITYWAVAAAIILASVLLISG
jgi:hypothetical protein